MAKITRKKLARGIKLLTSHVFSVLSDAATELTTANIEAVQLKCPNARFSLEYSLPYIGTDLLKAVGENALTWGVPWMLPPLQGDFAFVGDSRGRHPSYSNTLPPVTLEELHFSIDTRGEEASLVSHFWDSFATGVVFSDPGSLNFTALDINIHMSILEKDPTFFRAPTITVGTSFTDDDCRYGKEVWATKMPAVGFFLGGFDNNNPFVVTDLNVSIDRYKSYALVIRVEGLDPTDVKEDYVLVSPFAELVFSSPIVARSSGSGDVQNLPSQHGGAKTNSATPAITTPADATAIEADTAAGVQTNMDAVDSELQSKLRGGYDRWSHVPPTEHLAVDAAYTVIAVPLFQNRANGGIGADTWLEEPYIVGPTPSVGYVLDRRIIPIRFPMTIHHVIATWNWQSFVSTGRGPTPPLSTGGAAGYWPPADPLVGEIGVGLGTGMTGDDFDYAQVAYGGFHTPLSTSWGTSRIDVGARPTVSAGSSVINYDWELISIPLVDPAAPGTTGTGFVAQGQPIFAGRSLTTTEGRSGSFATAGGEQWIEVRGRMGAGGVAAPEDYDAESIFVGYQGIWVYIIGERYLV